MTDMVVTPDVGSDHVVGGVYFSPAHDMTYEVLGPATVWELAPDDAIRVRWSNGNVTTTRRELLVAEPELRAVG
jgi:hypothetical protein